MRNTYRCEEECRDVLDTRPRLAPPRLKSPSRQRSQLPVSTARTSPPRHPVRGTTASSSVPSVTSRVPGTVSRIPKLSESPSKVRRDSPSSTSSEERLETARLRKNANQYLQVNQVQASSAAGSDTVDSLDSQPKTFIVWTGTTVSTSSASRARDDLQRDSNNEAGDNSSSQQTTTINLQQQSQSDSVPTLDLPSHQPGPAMIVKRSGSMNEEYITLDLDSAQPQADKKTEESSVLEPIYESCPGSGEELGKKMRRMLLSGVWELSPVKFSITTQRRLASCIFMNVGKRREIF